ncbi:hypothetical protein L1987_41133 [Smallanthus sonchifolius]|uniref:Uncharacterized protein n=1 Tax=Smallanthus sonchifolius TaxID=185202 RepID=A0ACB9GUV5_9ASTR|nr:hypothetical protein L1987_41133 [Smallanthus sonchifolius]
MLSNPFLEMLSTPNGEKVGNSPPPMASFRKICTMCSSLPDMARVMRNSPFRMTEHPPCLLPTSSRLNQYNHFSSSCYFSAGQRYTRKIATCYFFAILGQRGKPGTNLLLFARP